jgi:ribonuclease HIII
MTANDKPSIFVTSIAKDVIEKLKKDLEEQGFEFTTPPYTHFSAKKKGVSCTLYTSLKLTVQGKEMAPFIEFYLEPEILKNVSFTYGAQAEPLDETGRIGVDESGKGDYFGPLCVAAVFAQGDGIHKLAKLGVKDSKKLTDVQILKIAKSIRDEFQHSLIRIGPAKYNELYSKFGNLNTLLAWGHATAIDHLNKISQCKCVLIDKFAHESLVQRALERKKIEVELTQKVRAEEDIVVAAASILARAAFVEGIDKLGKEVGMILPKGASSKVLEVGKSLVRQFGEGVLEKVGKLHFKTTQQILER